ncbi:hypothetical protein C8Q80DRAFT_1101302, partial [Daedaleopsis nitida]
ITAVLYPAAGGRPRSLLIRAPTHDAYVQEHMWMEACSLHRWFPLGIRAERVSVLPGTDFHLNNHYTILSTKDALQAPENVCIRGITDTVAYGNVLVVRHAASRPIHTTSVRSAERRFIDLVLRRYVGVCFCASALTFPFLG